MSLLMLFFFHSTLFASDYQKIIAGVEGLYGKGNSLEIHFRQKTYVQLLEDTITKDGLARFQKPKKFHIEYFSDSGKSYISDGKKLWVYQKGSDQARVMKVSDTQIPIEGLSLLGGLKNISQNFQVSEASPQILKKYDVKKDTLVWLHFLPKNHESRIEWILMAFDPKTYYAQRAFMKNKSENLTQYSFIETRLNPDLTPELFSFKKSGVKIIK